MVITSPNTRISDLDQTRSYSPKNIAIIPARGGSERIPDKNIRPFMGKPLIHWTIEAALQSECFDEVIVSTDSSRIAEIAKAGGATVPSLRQEHADSLSPASEATITTLNSLGQKWLGSDVVTQLLAVCPLRTSEDIRNANEVFQRARSDFLISCYRFGWMNPWWAMTLDADYRPSMLWESATSQRSQDLPSLFAPTGAIWMASIPKLLEAGTFYGPGHVCWEMPWQRAVDIDNEEDWLMAETLYRMGCSARVSADAV